MFLAFFIFLLMSGISSYVSCEMTKMPKDTLENQFHYFTTYYPLTNNVAIAEERPSYEDFDIIINLNCYWNDIYCITENERENHSKNFDIKQIDIKGKMYQTFDGKYKYVYYIGFSDERQIQHLLEELLPELVILQQQNPSLRFLFHCKKGMLRSIISVMSFLVKAYHISRENIIHLMHRSLPHLDRYFLTDLHQYMGYK